MTGTDSTTLLCSVGGYICPVHGSIPLQDVALARDYHVAVGGGAAPSSSPPRFRFLPTGWTTRASRLPTDLTTRGKCPVNTIGERMLKVSELVMT